MISLLLLSPYSTCQISRNKILLPIEISNSSSTDLLHDDLAKRGKRVGGKSTQHRENHQTSKITQKDQMPKGIIMTLSHSAQRTEAEVTYIYHSGH